MKKIILTAFTAILFNFTHFDALIAQEKLKGSGEITKQEKQLEGFSSVAISGAQEAVLMNGDKFNVIIETNANIQDRLLATVINGTLQFDLKNVIRYDLLKFYITAPYFEKISVSGASDVKSEGILKGEKLRLYAQGASNMNLSLAYTTVESKVSGSSLLVLNGFSGTHIINASGASDVNANELETETTVINASGASSCFVNATSSLTYAISGASGVKYVNKPETLIIQNSLGSDKVVVMNDSNWKSNVYNYYDTTKVHVGPINVEVYDGDTTIVTVGRHTLKVDENGNVSYERNKKIKFNGNWGGVEIGINGYVTPNFNTNWGAENDYLNLRYEKSVAINLNLYEQNFGLNKAKNVGLITGIGMSWNNYRFSQQTYLNPDNPDDIAGYYIDGTSVRKTKLTAMYITVPLLFEVQTKNLNRFRKFHFTTGVLASGRVRTHTKIYFNEASQPYSLQVPGSDNEYLPGTYVTPNASQRNIVKNYNSFYLQPFKFDATIRLGYGIINVFATYSLNSFFQKDRGPELYAWTAGIMLVGW